MADFEVRSVFWFLCVMCVAPVKIPCQLVKLFGVCVIPSKQADTVHGFQQWQDKCWQVVTWAPSMSTTADVWRTDVFSCWRCQRARHALGRAQNCLDPTGLQRSVCLLGDKKNPKHDDKSHFWTWNMVNYTKPDTRKRMSDRETIIYPQQRKWKHFHQ